MGAIQRKLPGARRVVGQKGINYKKEANFRICGWRFEAVAESKVVRALLSRSMDQTTGNKQRTKIGFMFVTAGEGKGDRVEGGVLGRLRLNKVS